MEATREAPPPFLSLEQLVLLKTFLDALEDSAEGAEGGGGAGGGA